MLPLNPLLINTEIPSSCGKVVDIAPLNQERQSIWLMLAEDGGLLRLDAQSGRSERVGRINLPVGDCQGPICRTHSHAASSCFT